MISTYSSSDIYDLGSKPKILLVDDQPTTIKIAKKYLDNFGFEVDTALNGFEALDILQKKPNIDLAILDIMMPKMNGLVLCKKLRESYSLYELPILFLTARDSIEDIIEGFEAGGNDFLIKPFDSNELLIRSKTLIKLKKLTEANTTLQKALELNRQFHRLTIHDLKNPLTSIMLLADVLSKSIGDKKELLEPIQLIQETSQRMLKMINDFLELSMLDMGTLVINKELVNIYSILNMVIETNKPQIEKKKQILIKEYPENDEFFINADPMRLMEIFDNLISNAIKYTSYNKKIWVKSSIVKKDPTDISILIEVKDEGQGIKENEKKFLFDRFNKLSSIPTGGETSHGIGLAITKQLVELHSGKIWAESQYGVGTSFFVELPV